MRTELPEFKRCCCCIPLRYGLLAFGYIRLIVSIPSLVLLFVIIEWSVSMYSRSEYFSIWEVLLPSFPAVLLLLDVALTFMFLVGGHRKSVKLLRVYYIYNIVMLFIGAAILIIICVLQSSMKRGYLFAATRIFAEVTTTATNIGFEIYFILLLRSEINKLKNSYNFRFHNHAAEECTIENGNTSVPLDDVQES